MDKRAHRFTAGLIRTVHGRRYARRRGRVNRGEKLAEIVGLGQLAVEHDGVGLMGADAVEGLVLVAGGDDAVAGAVEGDFELFQLAGFAAGEHDERFEAGLRHRDSMTQDEDVVQIRVATWMEQAI
ncbi:MAG TPA: hypothetical protein VKQ05_03230 [Gemmatimonadales bacterium]|nr:hypothetical protein [Gemmatimonadales bacterium]